MGSLAFILLLRDIYRPERDPERSFACLHFCPCASQCSPRAGRTPCVASAVDPGEVPSLFLRSAPASDKVAVGPLAEFSCDAQRRRYVDQHSHAACKDQQAAEPLTYS